MSDSAYRIGQILYVIPHDKPLVVPICIVEKRTSETVEGIVTTHVVRGPKPDARPYDLNTVVGQIYTSLDEVRRVMMENSRRAIEEMIGKAERAAQKAFGAKKSLPEPRPPSEPDVLDLDGIEVDEAPVDDDPQPRHVVQPAPPQRNGAIPSTVEVRGPDGKLQRVQIKQ